MSGNGRKVVTEGLEILMCCLDGAVGSGRRRVGSVGTRGTSEVTDEFRGKRSLESVGSSR